MAFRELETAIGNALPSGATARYIRLEALGRMLDGTFYDELRYSFDTEKVSGKKYIPLRERRPSVDFNLAYEITQDTQAELFGDEQFPAIHVVRTDDVDQAATTALGELVAATGLDEAVFGAYEEGVVGSVAVVVHPSDDGSPFFELLPGKWCEPIYRSEFSRELVGLVVTYPITREAAEEASPGVVKDKDNADLWYWFRYVVGPSSFSYYRPMAASRFARLGEIVDGERIAFVLEHEEPHAFAGRTPVVFAKNLGGRQRDVDGPALWWPVRNICVEIDYTLSQAGRGLRYTADPMLFVRRGEMDGGEDDDPAGFERPAGNTATQTADDGSMVRGATQVLVGTGRYADAKLLETSAAGISEEREFAKDLRELALEILGGQKARAEHLRAAASGKALDKGLKPLRRVVRRQRRPYGNGVLLALVDLVLFGYTVGAFSARASDVDVAAIPLDATRVLNWPNDETLQAQDLLYHVEALTLAAGGSMQHPKQLIEPKAIAKKLIGDLGLHGPVSALIGTQETLTPPPPPDPPKPTIAKP
jgi:hypothetical protein